PRSRGTGSSAAGLRCNSWFTSRFAGLQQALLFAVLDKPLTKSDAAPGQGAHHRPDGYLQNVGNLAILGLADGLEQENGAVQGRQPAHCLGQYRVTLLKHRVRVVKQDLEERLVQGRLPGIFDVQASGQFLVPGPRVLAVAVQRLQVRVPEDPGT